MQRGVVRACRQLPAAAAPACFMFWYLQARQSGRRIPALSTEVAATLRRSGIQGQTISPSKTIGRKPGRSSPIRISYYAMAQPARRRAAAGRMTSPAPENKALRQFRLRLANNLAAQVANQPIFLGRAPRRLSIPDRATATQRQSGLCENVACAVIKLARTRSQQAEY